MSIETAFDHIECSGLSHPEKDKLCAFVALETSLADAINLRHTDGFLMEILLAKTGKFNSNFMSLNLFEFEIFFFIFIQITKSFRAAAAAAAANFKTKSSGSSQHL